MASRHSSHSQQLQQFQHPYDFEQHEHSHSDSSYHPSHSDDGHHSHDGHSHDGHSHDGHSHDGHSHDSHSHGHSEGGKSRLSQREIKLIKISIAVTAAFMLAEIIIGYQFNALSLVADSYHMLNDIAAFIVQLYATELGELKRERTRSVSGFTYGFGRAQFLANLIIGVMLLALCLTLSLESLQRLYSPEIITMPPLVLGMGFIALIWNVTVFFMFSDTHGGHSHGGHSHAHSLGHDGEAMHPASYRAAVVNAGIDHRHDLFRRSTASERLVEHSQDYDTPAMSRRERRARRASSVATFGSVREAQVITPKAARSALAVHAIGDAAGNAAVIFDGIASWLWGPRSGVISGQWKPWRGIGYVDPICSLVVIWVILKHSFPLVTASSYALMQGIDPARINRYRRALSDPARAWVPSHLRDHFNVEYLDLHVWKLADHISFANVNLLVTQKHHDGVPLSGADVDDLIHSVKLRVFKNISVSPVESDMIEPENITVEVDIPPSHIYDNPHLSPAISRRNSQHALRSRSSISALPNHAGLDGRPSQQGDWLEGDETRSTASSRLDRRPSFRALPPTTSQRHNLASAGEHGHVALAPIQLRTPGGGAGRQGGYPFSQ